MFADEFFLWMYEISRYVRNDVELPRLVPCSLKIPAFAGMTESSWVC